MLQMCVLSLQRIIVASIGVCAECERTLGNRVQLREKLKARSGGTGETVVLFSGGGVSVWGDGTERGDSGVTMVTQHSECT